MRIHDVGSFDVDQAIPIRIRIDDHHLFLQKFGSYRGFNVMPRRIEMGDRARFGQAVTLDKINTQFVELLEG